MEFIKEEDETGPARTPPAPQSVTGFRSTDKKVIGLLLLILGVLTCTIAANVLHMRGTPLFVPDTTLAETTTADEDDEPLPELAPQPQLPAVPSQAEMAAVMEGELDQTTATAESLAPAGGFSDNLTDRDARCLQAPRMTPCSGPESRRPAFLFDGHRCVPPSSVPPPGCLDGRNRFRSLGHCRSACQGTDARAECGEPAQLVACSREHVKRRWFYPVNGSCVEWAFPEGNCVSEAVGLFQRMGQCVHDCLEHDVAAPACGEAPVAQRCGDYQEQLKTLHMIVADRCMLTLRWLIGPSITLGEAGFVLLFAPSLSMQVRYPVYSSVNQYGRLECLTVDPEDSRCLLGRNAFPSYRECARACLVS